MDANPERKCWTIQHVYANKYDDPETFDTTAVYITAESILNAIYETIDEVEENINIDGRAPPAYLATKQSFTVDILNNMLPHSWNSASMTIYEYPHLIVSVVSRVLY
jgi:uncharacterized Fe-S radical SAM superfamily protein PflX